MKLTPYPGVAERWRKVCKHVFNLSERWWDVYGDLVSWQRDWTILRAAGCLGGEDGHLAIAGSPAAREVADRNHACWIAAAESAIDDACAAGRAWTDEDRSTTRYVGDAGVMVVVARGKFLVTCFRPGGGRSRLSDAERTARVASRVALRAGVRRVERRASLVRARTE